MNKRKSKYMPLAEAIQRVMKSKGCSHDEGFRLIMDEVQKKKLPFRRVRTPRPAELSSNYPLNIFVSMWRLAPDDVLDELRSGRLVAQANDATKFLMRALGEVHTSQMWVTPDALQQWMDHPETPQHMIRQVKAHATN